MVVVAGTAARCEAWTVDPERRVLASKQGARELSFEVSGKTLAFTALTRYQGGEVDSNGSCHMQYEPRETEQAIVLGGAKLFRTAGACDAALASHERVATRLECAGIEDPVPEPAQRASRTRFEAMLAGGGTLYSPAGETCQAVRVRAQKTAERGVLEGELEYDVVDEDGMKGTTSSGYSMRRGASQIMLLGSSTTWRDGTGIASGCMDVAHIELRERSVVLSGEAYFTAAACRAAIEAERVRGSWYPLPPGDELAEGPAHPTQPSLGGC